MGPLIGGIATIAVLLCWPFYVALFLRKRGNGSAAVSEDRRSKVGIVIQYLGAVITWVVPRSLFSPFLNFGFPGDFAIPIMAVILAVGAVWFSLLSLRALGSQWRFVAGVDRNHRLVQQGPYAIVRHPLYLCFFAITLATGMIWTSTKMLPVALAVFVTGTVIRVRTEEGILQRVFGEEFERYTRNVPAFWPRLI